MVLQNRCALDLLTTEKRWNMLFPKWRMLLLY
jgi:hypothetical protein